MSGFMIPTIDNAPVNTRYVELVTTTRGTFRFRKFGALSGGVGKIDIPETGQAFPSGQPSPAFECKCEFYMADVDEFVRMRSWVKASKARAKGYLEPCTAVYHRDGGAPSQDFPLPEVWVMDWSGSDADQAASSAGRMTVTLIIANAELPPVL